VRCGTAVLLGQGLLLEAEPYMEVRAACVQCCLLKPSNPAAARAMERAPECPYQVAFSLHRGPATPVARTAVWFLLCACRRPSPLSGACRMRTTLRGTRCGCLALASACAFVFVTPAVRIRSVSQSTPSHCTRHCGGRSMPERTPGPASVDRTVRHAHTPLCHLRLVQVITERHKQLADSLRSPDRRKAAATRSRLRKKQLERKGGVGGGGVVGTLNATGGGGGGGEDDADRAQRNAAELLAELEWEEGRATGAKGGAVKGGGGGGGAKAKSKKKK
jgi:hypothetical protein